jgi:arylsulfatase A-like enzyme
VRGHRTLDYLLHDDEPNLLRILLQAGYHVAHAGMRGDTFAPGMTQESTSRFGFEVKPHMAFMKSPFEKEDALSRAFYHGERKGLRPDQVCASGFALDMDEATIQTAEQWLSGGLPEPFALYVPLIFPHPPFEVEEPYFSMYDRAKMAAPLPIPSGDTPRFMREMRELYGTDRLGKGDWAEIRATYQGMVSRVDDQLGRVLAGLEEAGVRDRTASFFFTDHGEYLGDYGLIEKWSAGQHDCLLRNPLVVDIPGGVEGQVCSGMAELVDLLPTVLELADIEPSHSHSGRSLVPALTGGETGRETAFSEGGFTLSEKHLLEQAGYPYDLKAKLQNDDPVSVGRVFTIRTKTHTYVRRLYEDDELYDRQADPGELENLSGRPENAELEAELRTRLLDLIMETGDVIPWKGDGRFDAIGAVVPKA